jgi:hypothetical protein
MKGGGQRLCLSLQTLAMKRVTGAREKPVFRAWFAPCISKAGSKKFRVFRFSFMQSRTAFLVLEQTEAIFLE